MIFKIRVIKFFNYPHLVKTKLVQLGISPIEGSQIGGSPVGGSPIGGSPNGGSPSPIGVSPNGVRLNGVSPNGVSPNGVSPIDPSVQMGVVQLGIVQLGSVQMGLNLCYSVMYLLCLCGCNLHFYAIFVAKSFLDIFCCFYLPVIQGTMFYCSGSRRLLFSSFHSP